MKKPRICAVIVSSDLETVKDFVITMVLRNGIFAS